MVRPAQRRALAVWAREAYGLSERRACRAVGACRSSLRYRSVRPHQEVLRQRIKELASVRVRSGYKQLHALLRREGWEVNHKRVYRLYREEGLVLRRKGPRRRHRSATRRLRRAMPKGPNEQWAMDFMHDTLASGKTIRVLTAIDICTRECVALVASSSFTGESVAEILTRAGQERTGLPAKIRVDNGTEFTSKALDHWAYWNQVELDFSRPAKPVDDAFIESFNATLRRECFSQHWFTSVADAQRTLGVWRQDYNNTRPHGSLADVPPAEYRRGGHYVPDRRRLENSLS